MSDAREMFISTIRKVAEEFATVQPISVSTENLKRSMDRVLAAFRSMAIGSPKLYECTPASVARAVALSAMTGLMPGKGTLAQVDLIPRKRRVKVDDQWRDILELDWQMGWRGYVALAERAGMRLRPPTIVYEGDVFDYSEVPPRIEHKPDPRGTHWGEWDKMVGVYVMGDRGSGPEFLYLPMKAIADRREKSESWRNWLEWYSAKESGKPLTWPDGNPKVEPDCPWLEWPVEMAQKTMIRWAAQRGWLPMDDMGAHAVQQDSVGDHAQRPALPDYDPVGLNDQPVRQREAVPTRGGAAIDAAMMKPRSAGATERALLINTFRELEAELGYQPAVDADSLSDDALKAAISKYGAELDARTQGSEVDRG